MKAVGEDRDRPGDVAEDDLDEGDREVEEQDAVEDAGHSVVTLLVARRCRRACFARRASSPRSGRGRQNTCAVGMGHQRNCTRPMMYFFGTKPQWRLSELLFRWSPMTK